MEVILHNLTIEMGGTEEETEEGLEAALRAGDQAKMACGKIAAVCRP